MNLFLSNADLGSSFETRYNRFDCVSDKDYKLLKKVGDPLYTIAKHDH